MIEFLSLLLLSFPFKNSLKSLHLFCTPLFNHYHLIFIYRTPEKIISLWDLPPPFLTPKDISSAYSTAHCGMPWTFLPSSHSLPPWDSETETAAHFQRTSLVFLRIPLLLMCSSLMLGIFQRCILPLLFSHPQLPLGKLTPNQDFTSYPGTNDLKGEAVF